MVRSSVRLDLAWKLLYSIFAYLAQILTTLAQNWVLSLHWQYRNAVAVSSYNKTTREVQFYLTFLDSDAQLLGRVIRKHWGIENQAHWTLDCTFAEDPCRIRSFHSPRNLAVLRRIALNALNCEPTYKRSLRQKMKRAAMDNDYLIQIISYCFLA